jgi:ATP-dependent DNA helicase RecG
MPQRPKNPDISRSPSHSAGHEERLKRVLLHERGLGYSDKAVIGGLDSLIRSFATDIAWLNNLPPRQSRPYAALGPGERQIWVEKVLQRIGNQPTAAPARQPVSPAKASASSPTPARSRQRRTTRAATRPAPPPPQSLSTPISELGFISRANVGKLTKLNVHTLKDLLWLFPRRHIDYSKPTKIGLLELGQETTVLGHVVRTENLNIGRTGAARVLVSDNTGLLSVTFFGQPYLVDRLKPGTDIALSGKVGEFRGQAQLENPEYEVIGRNTAGTTHAGNLLPVYPATDGLPQRTLRTATRAALDAGLPLVKDMLPTDMRNRLEMPTVTQAISDMHFPTAMSDAEKGRRRLALDELLLNQLLVLRNRVRWQERANSPQIKNGAQIAASFLAGLEFTLTDDQQSVLNGLFEDMTTGVPMARLLQGEVGSGKTIVALSAILACVANGFRGVFLAPTEVLAEQHFLSTTRQLGAETSPLLPATVMQASAPWNPGGPITIGLLTGSQSAAQKSKMHQQIASGDIDIIIGTHALLQETVDIPDLALAVVDEQHRFGVEQRAALIRREPRPHMLAMSATPIPRTLALTVYGDLDVSVLKQMPRNRSPLKTSWVRDEMSRQQAYQHIRSEVTAGRQAFVVCPLIDDSEAIEARAAVPEFERLVAGPLAGLKLGLLHGRMPIAEKQAVMEKFRNNEVQVLVATPVIEVGVDVPNATIMLIESADRFGLSQLHQLRGRVGRGQHRGTCYLLSDSPSEDGITRLRTVEETSNGFALADKDLEMRGPGDYTGTRQSGWALMQIATPADIDLIEICRDEATNLLETDPGLKAPEHALLSSELERFAEGRPGELS